MKLISLNAWGGRSLYLLMKFLRRVAPKTDIFCLQEIFDADQAVLDELHPEEHVSGPLFKKISDALPDFAGSLARFDDNPNRQTLATFIRKTIHIKTVSDFTVYQPAVPRESGSFVISSRKLQYAVLETPSGECTVANFHGLWTGGAKTDTPERLAQSKNIRKFLDGIEGPKVLCGDFNLLPETASMRRLEQGMRDLVREAHIQSTRTPLYREYEDPDFPNFADYILVSPEVRVERFEVLPDIASDHCPLLLDFS